MENRVWDQRASGIFGIGIPGEHDVHDQSEFVNAILDLTGNVVSDFRCSRIFSVQLVEFSYNERAKFGFDGEEHEQPLGAEYIHRPVSLYTTFQPDRTAGDVGSDQHSYRAGRGFCVGVLAD